MRNKIDSLSKIQKEFTFKKLITNITSVLVIASIVKVLYQNFDADMLMLRDYLYTAPSLLIVISFIRNIIKDNPIVCYEIKGIISVGGILMLVVVELNNGDPIWYFIDALLISFIPLLTNPHRNYYQSVVSNNCKTFSEVMGIVDVCGDVVRIVFGLSLIYFDIDVLYILMVVLILDTIERYYDIKIAKVIFGQKELETRVA